MYLLPKRITQLEALRVADRLEVVEHISMDWAVDDVRQSGRSRVA